MSDRGQRHFAACGLALLAAASVASAGCTPAAPESAHVSDRVELTPVDRADFDAAIARSKGHVVLVDCWATWCLPCVEQLPHSIALAKLHGAEALAVVTLDFDDPDSADQVRRVLAKSGAAAADVTNLQAKLGSSSEAMDAFEIASGALPHYKLFDRQGRLRQTFELDPTAAKQFTTADIDAAVEKLLAE